MKIDDIDGSKSKQLHKPRERSPDFNNYDYSDITKAQFVSTRVTNPLSPSYKARDEDGKLIDIGDVEGSRPGGLPRAHNTEQKPFNLRTEDITGAQASTKGLGAFTDTFKRTGFKESMKVNDIAGANAGSLKKGP